MRTVSTFPLMEGDPGLVTHWAPGKFAPTGQAFMNKVLNGRSFRVATGTHNVTAQCVVRCRVATARNDDDSEGQRHDGHCL